MSYKNLNPWIKTFRLLKKGKIDESINVLNKILKKSQNAGLNRTALYNLAICYHRKGDFKKSIEYLEQMNKEQTRYKNNNLEGAYFALYGHNLLMLRQDLDLATTYLEQATTLTPLTFLPLYKAYLSLISGNLKAAEAKFSAFLQNQKKQKMIIGFLQH